MLGKKFMLSLVIWLSFAKCEQEDFYTLLGVSKSADNREIRKAFKQLAVKLHPDKNPDDEEAQANFIVLSKAYETLKDPELRKHYDLYGNVKNEQAYDNKKRYQSYQYYQEDFGIYDDDPLIVTLSLFDFETNINDENMAWFVNFYSPQCSHCHTLAPIWRKLATELEGVVRIAAVNCFEDWQLCHQLNIRAYPSLRYYSHEDHMYQGEDYEGSRTVAELEDYVLKQLNPALESITEEKWTNYKTKDWLLFLCGESETGCPEKKNMLKLTVMLQGLLPVGIIYDDKLCNKISDNFENNPVIFWKAEEKNVERLNGFDTQDLIKEVLENLPELKSLNIDDFQDIRTRLRLGDSDAWLICFHIGPVTEVDLQLKRLPTFLPNIQIGKLHCAQNAGLCKSLHISRYPTWGILKAGGAFEILHGKDSLHDIVSFAKDSSQATNLHALSPADVKNILEQGETWFIDWYAPWCPPCQRLMPELRRASQHFSPETVQFGTVDCTLHSQFCSNHGVQSYPTTTFYNGTKKQHFHGKLQENSIVDFVFDMLNPIVISLDSDSFYSKLGNKPANEMWIVDFFAPWCGPCQKFAPQYRALARQMQHLNFFYVAEVDCVAQQSLCSSQNIRSYPTIRLFPLGNKGFNTVAIYNGHHEVSHLKKWIINFLPSPVLELTKYEFDHDILSGYTPELPWLIDFYSPWCSHCVVFEPEFIIVAQKLDGVVRTGKLNCQNHQVLCSSQNIHQYPTVKLYFSSSLVYEIESQNSQEIIESVKKLISLHKKEIHDEL